MIKVTLVEKPKEEKPFPKLMIRKDEHDYTLILATGQNGNKLKGIVISTDYRLDGIGVLVEGFSASLFTDYNEPITLQNA